MDTRCSGLHVHEVYRRLHYYLPTTSLPSLRQGTTTDMQCIVRLFVYMYLWVSICMDIDSWTLLYMYIKMLLLKISWLGITLTVLHACWVLLQSYNRKIELFDGYLRTKYAWEYVLCWCISWVISCTEIFAVIYIISFTFLTCFHFATVINLNLTTHWFILRKFDWSLLFCCSSCRTGHVHVHCSSCVNTCTCAALAEVEACDRLHYILLYCGLLI